MIVVDTGPIVAATFRDDKNHERCVREFMRLHNTDRPLLVPSFVAGECSYIGGADAGHRSDDDRRP